MASDSTAKRGLVTRLLDGLEWLGNKLPDPAVLFVIGMVLVWVLSWQMSSMTFTEVNPATKGSISVENLLAPDKLAEFLGGMVEQFTSFHPLGVVLVAMLGVGVAEASGFINVVLKNMLQFTPKKLLTPMLLLVAIVSHTAADAGYVLVIPIGGVMFYAAGRHPLAGIAAAFAGVSGGFSANFIPSGIDPLLSGLTTTGAEIVDKDYVVNPLCNIVFTGVSSILIIGVGWFLTDYIIEPRLKETEIDGDPSEMPKLEQPTKRDQAGMICGLLAMLLGFVGLFLWAAPAESALRAPRVVEGTATLQVDDDGTQSWQVATGTLIKTTQARILRTTETDGKATTETIWTGAISALTKSDAEVDEVKKDQACSISLADAPALQAGDVVEASEEERSLTSLRPAAPLMSSIVPLIFLLFLIPGVVHGYVSGTFKSHRDIVKGMSKSMESMAYYMVLVFFAALFIAAFSESKIGILLAVKGANFLKESGASPAVTIVGIILLAGSVNLLVGSASAKWAMLSPIFVPMLMLAGDPGISPELTQAAYRIGDSSTNIITPMMPYFPLVVVFCQRYVKKSGIGTVGAMMLPYSIVFLIAWTIMLLIYWQLGFPLGLQAPYTYEAAAG
ncbi:MAG: AbgT family transporter [Planctomycetaceae bacterium]